MELTDNINQTAKYYIGTNNYEVQRIFNGNKK